MQLIFEHKQSHPENPPKIISDLHSGHSLIEEKRYSLIKFIRGLILFFINNLFTPITFFVGAY